jgi:hypothetical protein
MRNLVVLIIGIALGALIATTIVNALARHDAFPRGVMQVMQHHYGQIRNDLRARSCSSLNPAPEKALLNALVEEIGPAVYGDATPEPPFREFTQKLRDALAQLPDSAASCAALAPLVSKIGSACDDCHRQYR